MKESGWLERELSSAAEEVSKWPEWKRWGAEIETRDTAEPPQKTVAKSRGED
jgi:hypothetical protein